MCLIALARDAVPGVRLAVLANRDEFHARPTSPAQFWSDHPDVLAGRDLEAGGTWMGVTQGGRFAALTNCAAIRGEGAKSRGHLVADFLTCSRTKGTGALDYVAGIAGDDYAGFNLVLFDGESLVLFSNDRSEPRVLGTGVHAISNTSIDVDWPKMRDSRTLLANSLAAGLDKEAMFAGMRDCRQAADSELPAGDAPLELKRRTSSRFVLGPDYGTRCTTLVIIGRGQVDFEERAFGPMGEPADARQFTFAL